MFRMLTTVIASLLAVYMTGCGSDEVEVNIQADMPAKFVAAFPPGAELGVNADIILYFDKMPTDLTSSVGTVTVETSPNRGVSLDRVRMRLTGPFLPPGPLEIILTWAGGTKTLNYTITVPCADEDTGCD